MPNILVSNQQLSTIRPAWTLSDEFIVHRGGQMYTKASQLVHVFNHVCVQLPAVCTWRLICFWATQLALAHYFHVHRVNELFVITLEHAICLCSTVIGTFSLDLFVHRLWRMLVHTQVKPLCACMLACLRIAFYDVYTAPFF